MRLWHRCFPVNFTKFLRTSFLTEHRRWLLLLKQRRFRETECIRGQKDPDTLQESLKLMIWNITSGFSYSYFSLIAVVLHCCFLCVFCVIFFQNQPYMQQTYRICLATLLKSHFSTGFLL